MANKKCGACGKTYRTGTLAYVQTAAGLVQKRVGPCCSKGAMLLVTVPGAVCSCGSPATTCGRCAEKKAMQARVGAVNTMEVVKKIRGWISATKLTQANSDDAVSAYQDGRVAALESVVELLKSGRAG